jgi:dinuclear metal center YbgI/SA1388 family protein
MLGRMSQTLSEVLALLERLAPLNLAEEWDNVGLLLEPSAAALRPIERVLLCIDLSERVLDEALVASADFLIAYHPPLFRAVKRLRASVAEERVLLRALEAGVAVYSPHTALDAAAGGVNDWLASAFGAGRSRPQAGDTPAALVDNTTAHLIADFRDLVGLTPGAFVKRSSLRSA